MPRTLRAHREAWPIAGGFRISRGAKTEAEVVTVRIAEGAHAGCGECVPYARYGETVEGVLDAIGRMAPRIESGLARLELQSAMPAGAARNAIDCALADLEAKQSGKRAYELFGLAPPAPAITAYTISLGTPEEMAAAAARAADRPLLKVKLGGTGDEARIAAVRKAAPTARLIADANEAWTPALLAPMAAACAAAGVELIEQPLGADADEPLRSFKSPVPLCADESCKGLASLAALKGKYHCVNVKLDKTGGITEAVALARAARAQDFTLMLGCMVATSLAIAPIFMLATLAAYIDLDGPILLTRDRPGGLTYDHSLIHPPTPDLWG